MGGTPDGLAAAPRLNERNAMSEQTTALVWMDDLDVDVCWRLIAGQPVGRVGFVWDGRPKVLPVNHAVDEKTIVVRTEHDTMLGGLHSDQIVAFEVDGADNAAETGWSVLVEGRTVEVTTPREMDRLSRITLHPWAPGERDQWVRIMPTSVTGRAISRRRSTPRGPLLPYLPPA
jgi:nitroimidazol reductase NimA-like FMN-containing flavoprotein (pyridoxamine 5'-phosphate oxidase superfamily)